jgi:hypothetical protein
MANDADRGRSSAALGGAKLGPQEFDCSALVEAEVRTGMCLGCQHQDWEARSAFSAKTSRAVAGPRSPVSVVPAGFAVWRPLGLSGPVNFSGPRDCWLMGLVRLS